MVLFSACFYFSYYKFCLNEKESFCLNRFKVLVGLYLKCVSVFYKRVNSQKISKDSYIPFTGTYLNDMIHVKQLFLKN